MIGFTDGLWYLQLIFAVDLYGGGFGYGDYLCGFCVAVDGAWGVVVLCIWISVSWEAIIGFPAGGGGWGFVWLRSCYGMFSIRLNATKRVFVA